MDKFDAEEDAVLVDTPMEDEPAPASPAVAAAAKKKAKSKTSSSKDLKAEVAAAAAAGAAEEEDAITDVAAAEGPTAEELAAEEKKRLEATQAQAESEKTLGNACYSSGDMAGAIRHYTEAISLAPTNAAYYSNRAAAYLMQSLPGKSIADCDAALALDPTHVKSLLRKGKCSQQMGKFVEARACYARAIEIEPHNKDAKTELETVTEIVDIAARATAALEKEDFRKVLNDTSRGMELAPKWTKLATMYVFRFSLPFLRFFLFVSLFPLLIFFLSNNILFPPWRIAS